MGYKDNAVLTSGRYTLAGGTAGIYWSIGYDISISRNLALGFQLSLISGSLSKYKIFYGTRTEVIKLDKDAFENLSRIDISAGLRFNR
jgi:hypothetical protein